MGGDELLMLFRTELESDIPQFRRFLDNLEIEKLKSFAHKYKVRLHYLGHNTCYELCLDIERYYREGENDEILMKAKSLLEGLEVILNQ